MPAGESRRIRGIVFDLWNTLVYNRHRPNPIIALGEAFGLRETKGWTKTIERGMMLEKLSGIEEGLETLERHTGRRLDSRTRVELAGIWREACAQTRFFPEVREALEALALRFPLGLLSNTQSFDLEFLENEGLPFRATVFSYEMGALKPDPRLFLRISERLGIPPSDLLMVGDNFQDDILGAEAVGMRALLIRRDGASLSFQEPHPDREALSSIQPLLEMKESLDSL
jgi:FMN phosphatase YigB (HAD superfamily)